VTAAAAQAARDAEARIAAIQSMSTTDTGRVNQLTTALADKEAQLVEAQKQLAASQEAAQQVCA
jgi:hypothetical protein